MPGLDPPELHQLADQALHARRVVLHDADMLGDVGREAVTVEQLLARPVDQRQGGAELVGDAGEKAEFRLIDSISSLRRCSIRSLTTNQTTYSTTNESNR